MSRVMQAWETLRRAATSRDYDEKQYAAFQIGLILERHYHANDDAPDLYEVHLSRELQRLTLDEARQRETLDYLVALVKADPQSADAFLHAMSRANPRLLAEPLLNLLAEHGRKLRPRSAYQAVLALNGVLRDPDAGITAALRAQSPQPLLATWAEDNDDALADRAAAALDRLTERLSSVEP